VEGAHNHVEAFIQSRIPLEQWQDNVFVGERDCGPTRRERQACRPATRTEFQDSAAMPEAFCRSEVIALAFFAAPLLALETIGELAEGERGVPDNGA